MDTIVVNAAGCGSAMKEYGHLLRDDPAWAARAKAFAAKVRDVTEVLAGFDRRAHRGIRCRCASPITTPVIWRTRQGVRQQPRELLASIPGVTVVPIAESEICCGSAGIFNLVQPEMAAALGDRKAGHIDDDRRRRRGHLESRMHPADPRRRRTAPVTVPVVHIVEILDASIRGVEPAAI